MHILELPSFFLPHGGRFCLEQAKALKALGHEVRILSVVELGLRQDRLRWLTAPWSMQHTDMEGIAVDRLFMRAIPKAANYNLGHWVDVCCRMADRYISRYGRPDVVHAHCCKMAGLAAQQIALHHGVPYVITEHLSSGLYERDFGRGWQRQRWLPPLMQMAYKHAGCVVPVSLELVQNLAPFFGTDYSYRPVSNIIDTNFFSFRERPDRRGRPFRLCCLAIANIREKGYDVLADAMRHMPDGVELHIAGEGTDGTPMRRLFAGINGVTLRGHLEREEVRRLLWQSDALVLPSRSEAQPLVVMEALATGIPVVGTECIPASQRIAGACLTAPVGDADALRQQMLAVQAIAPSPAFAEAVRAIASPATVAKQLEEIMLDVCGR